MQNLAAYIPMDRRQALARGETLPDRCTGAALFADISGFTPLARAFARELGPQRGAEALLDAINPAYAALIAPLHRYGGSVISFAGDAITCWFDNHDHQDLTSFLKPVRSATACALAMQAAMTQFATVATPNGTTLSLSIKIAIAAGPARRFLVGDPDIMLIDALAGATLARMADAEHHAERGAVVVSVEVAEALGNDLEIAAWRARFAVVTALARTVAPVSQAPLGQLTATQIQAWLLPVLTANWRNGTAEIGSLRPVTPLFLKFGGIDYDRDNHAGAKLDAFVRHVQQTVQQRGGSLLQLIIGDKGAYTCVVFGAPVAHEDDAARALHTALALRDLPAELAYITGLQMGLTRGNLWAGNCGASIRRTYAVMGSDVNLAARLMAKAQPGQILVSARVADTLGFEYTHLGDWQYKGFAAPLPTYQLCGEQLASARVFADVMVGRETELQQLRDCAQPLFAGQLAGAAIIYGEAGMGKSRLAYALRLALGKRVTWFTAQTDQILHQAFNPFVYWLKRYFDQAPEVSAAVNQTRFAERLARLQADLQQRASNGKHQEPAALHLQAIIRELVRTRSFLGALLGLHWPDSLYAQLDAALRYQNTLTAIKNLLRAASCLRPVVLELEDGHWLDAASQELLTTLSQNAAAYPLLILITSRYADDGTPPRFDLAADFPTRILDLSTLSSAALRQQTETILAGPVTEALLTALQDRTQANPFFVQQVLYYFRENNLLERNPDGVWQLKTTTTSFDIVADATKLSYINAILVARIDRLAQQVKGIVQSAAVLGREFAVPILAQMLQVDVLPDVQHAAREQIWSALVELRYIFKHALLRDAAYAMQLQTRRRELHCLAAATFERLYADDLPPYYGALAYHYATAYRQGLTKVRDQALTYLHQAGQQAADNYENAAAIDHFSQALALAPAGAAEIRYALLLGREEVYHLLGERVAQSQDLDSLQAAAVTLADDAKQTQVALRQARYAGAISDYLAVATAAQLAIRLSCASGNLRDEATGYLHWSEALWRQGNLATSQTKLAQALALTQSVGSKRLEAESLSNLGSVYWYLGDLVKAKTYYEQFWHICCETGDRQSESAALNALGLVSQSLGDYVHGINYLEQSLRLCREIGHQRSQSMALVNLGYISDQMGNYARASDCHRQALRSCRETGDRHSESITLSAWGLLFHHLNENQTAQSYTQQALHIAQEIGSLPFQGYALTRLGHALTALEDFSQAADVYQQAWALRCEIGVQHLAMESLAGLTRVALLQDDLAQAQAHVAEILSYLATGTFDGTDEPLRVYLTCYRVLHAAADSRAPEVLTTAHTLLQAQAARIPDAPTRRSFMENIAAHREIVAAWVDLE